jgi:hypothetical protein
MIHAAQGRELGGCGFFCNAVFPSSSGNRACKVSILAGEKAAGAVSLPGRDVSKSAPMPAPKCPVSASNPSIACSSKPRPTPLPISPRPRSRCWVVVKLISLVSWIESTWRPAHASAISLPQPAISASTVTRGLARNHEKPTMPPRRPPARRRRQMLSRATIHDSNKPPTPFLPGVRRRNRPASNYPKTSKSTSRKTAGSESPRARAGQSSCVHTLERGRG